MSGDVSPRITITRMQNEHVPAVFQLDQASFSLPWSERSYLFEVNKNETSIPLVALESGVVTGFIVVWQVEDEAHIGTIAAHPDFRQRGVAEALLRQALRDAASRGAVQALLEVRRSNLPAQALYRKFGFVTTGVRPKYYQDNQEDAFLMTLDPLEELE